MKHTEQQVMNTPTKQPYAFGDALHRVRMNIMTYQECFDESTEQYQQNEKLLKIIDAACAPKAAQNLTALVFMADPSDNFFIEDAPKGDPSKWIDRYVHNIEDVEFVQVNVCGGQHAYWSNPNCCPEA